MAFGWSCLFLALAVAGCVSAECQPKAETTTYSSQNAGVLTAIPFIAELTLSCVPSGPLYARVGQRLLPAVRLADGRHQISWTEEVSEASSGDREILLYNEAGYTALRKAMRTEQDISSVQSLLTVVLSHSTGYNGPWINSEIMAAIMSIAVAYVALTNKSRLLS